jgi:hypothetical protein
MYRTTWLLKDLPPNLREQTPPLANLGYINNASRLQEASYPGQALWLLTSPLRA